MIQKISKAKYIVYELPRYLFQLGEKCLTNGGNHPQERCAFPFTYHFIKYNECTAVDNNGIPWCSTHTLVGHYVTGYWGNCADNCPGNRTYCP